MKTVHLFFFAVFQLLILNGSLRAQSPDCPLSIMIFVADDADEMTVQSMNYCKSKLTNIATSNGLLPGEGLAQFSLTSTFSLINQEILPGPPTQFVNEYNVTLIIGDYYGQKIFSSTSLNLKGVGENEAKAYLNAIGSIRANSKDIQAFVSQARSKIMAYYNNNFQTIVSRSQFLAKQKRYEEALFHLYAVPECSKGGQIAQRASLQIYQDYVDHLCVENLAKAKSAWYAQQNSEGASQAAEYLSFIYPDARCYKDAQALYREIKGKVDAEWKFTLKVYDMAVSLERQRIEAIRAIGVAYGTHQKPDITHISWR